MPELSRKIVVDDIGDRPMVFDIAASEEERRALAERFGLAAVDRFVGRARLVRAPARDGSGPAIRVEFGFEAEVVQNCVVTLEPVPARCAETGLVVEYTTAAPAAEPPAVADVPPEGIDPPEPLAGEAVDAGELLAEHLGLALDPWPRAPGAALDAGTEGETRDRPFEALAALRGNARRDSG